MRITEKPEEELTQKVEFCRPCELENSDVGHKRIEEANFIELQEGYRAIFESANDIFLLIDRKGKIIDVNEKLTEIGGYEREELVGKNIRSLAEITTRKSLAVIVRNFLKRMVGVNVPPYEIELFKKTGELVTFEVNARALRKDGRIVGDLAILRDVTERKQAEQALRESGEIYRSLVNNVRVGVFRSTPGRSGRFLEVNPAMEDITGYSREELLQMNVADLYVHPKERAAVLKEMASGVVKKPRELLFKKKDGTEIVVSDRKVAVRDSNIWKKRIRAMLRGGGLFVFFRKDLVFPPNL